MGASLEHESRASPDPVYAAALDAWLALKNHLARRSEQLCDEVRNYPTPIARCDEQLTELIEQRTLAIARLKRALAAGPQPSGQTERAWLAAVDEFLLSAQNYADDDTAISLRKRLRAAMRALREKA